MLLSKLQRASALWLLAALAMPVLSESQSSSSGGTPTTDSLPTLRLEAREFKVFDYPVTVGEPEQTLMMRLDVANGMAWLPGSDGFVDCDSPPANPSASTASSAAMPSSSSDSDSDSYPCASQGIYNIHNSSTGNFLSGSGAEEGGSNSLGASILEIFTNYVYISGNNAEDDFKLRVLETFENGTSHNITVDLEQQKFVNANDSNVSTGGMGVGAFPDGYTSNFLQSFVDDEIIETNSYSLAISPYGPAELILGGISSSKYTGDLHLFDFIPLVDESESFVTSDYGYTKNLPVVPITAFGVTSNSSGTSVKFSNVYDDKITTGTYPRPALLDTRTFYNYIPYSALIELAVELNAYYTASVDSWIVDCNVGSIGTIDIYFGNMDVNLPISSVLYPAKNKNGSDLVFENGDKACYLAFLPDYVTGFTLLGTPFLKNVYLAVNNEEQVLALASAKTETAETEVTMHPIQSGIPLARTNNLTDYGSLTLTIPSSINVTATIEHSSQAFISNGEVYIGNNGSSPNPLSSDYVPGSTSNSASGSYSSSRKGEAPRGSVNFNLGYTMGSILLILNLL
uniref:Peptidase A1 domain-containing protein n=1 Tax=Ogataea minuta TaxID=36026 RepID=Q25C38_9ASCO|nr:hypothetical protein [Ogataea minuta]